MALFGSPFMFSTVLILMRNSQLRCVHTYQGVSYFTTSLSSNPHTGQPFSWRFCQRICLIGLSAPPRRRAMSSIRTLSISKLHWQQRLRSASASSFELQNGQRDFLKFGQFIASRELLQPGAHVLRAKLSSLEIWQST